MKKKHIALAVSVFCENATNNPSAGSLSSRW
jgi:hypothetical protein